MFNMRANNRDELVSPNEFIFQNSELKNLFYDMNSIVNLTDSGGLVTFSNSFLNRITICGALIKNYDENYPYQPNLTVINDPNIFSLAQKQNLTKMRRIQSSYVDYSQSKQNPNKTNTYNCTGDCFKIAISGSTFMNFQFGSNLQASLHQVNLQNGLRHQGAILNLNKFQGQVRITDSNFTDNQFAYDGCLTVNSSSLTPLSPLDNLNLLYNTQSQYNLYQLKALITIQHSSRTVFLVGNTFTRNVAFKGIINIDISEGSIYPVIVSRNNFTQNAALVSANALYIRKRNTKNLLGSDYTTLESFGCGGIELSSNTFVHNVGCPSTHGAVKVYCFDPSGQQISSKIQYIQSYDSQNFVDDTGDSSLLTAFGSNSLSHAYMNDSYTNQSMEIVTFQVNMQALAMKNNFYHENMAGNMSSVAQIEGFPIANFDNETYLGNINFIPNIYKNLSPLYGLQSDKTLPAILSGTVNQSSISYFAQAPLSIYRPLKLTISNGITFDGNLIIPSSYSFAQATSILVIDFYGTFTLEGGSLFQNHAGLVQNSLLKNESISSTDSKITTLNISFIKFYRSQLSPMTVDNVTIQSNVISNIVGLITFEKSNQQLFQNLNISNIVSKDGSSIVKLDQSNVTLYNCSFENISLSRGYMVYTKFKYTDTSNTYALQSLQFANVTKTGTDGFFTFDQKDLSTTQASNSPSLNLKMDSLTFSTIFATIYFQFIGLETAFNLTIPYAINMSVTNLTFVKGKNGTLIQFSDQNITSTSLISMKFRYAYFSLTSQNLTLLNLGKQELQSTSSSVDVKVYADFLSINNSLNTVINIDKLSIMAPNDKITTTFHVTSSSLDSLGTFLNIPLQKVNGATQFNNSFAIRNSTLNTLSANFFNISQLQLANISTQIYQSLSLKDLMITDCLASLYSNQLFNVSSGYMLSSVNDNIEVSDVTVTDSSNNIGKLGRTALISFPTYQVDIGGALNKSLNFHDNCNFTQLDSMGAIIQYNNTVIKAGQGIIMQDSFQGQIMQNIKSTSLIDYGNSLILNSQLGSINQSLNINNYTFENFSGSPFVKLADNQIITSSGLLIMICNIINSKFTNITGSDLFSMGKSLTAQSISGKVQRSFNVISNFTAITGRVFSEPSLTITAGSDIIVYYIFSSSTTFTNIDKELLYIKQQTLQSLTGSITHKIEASYITINTLKTVAFNIQSRKFSSSQYQSITHSLTDSSVTSANAGLMSISNIQINTTSDIILLTTLNRVNFLSSQTGLITQSGIQFLQAAQSFTQTVILDTLTGLTKTTGALYQDSQLTFAVPIINITSTIHLKASNISSTDPIFPVLQLSSQTYLAQKDITVLITIDSCIFREAGGSVVAINEVTFTSNGGGNVRNMLNISNTQIYNKRRTAVKVQSQTVNGAASYNGILLIAGGSMENLSGNAIEYVGIIASTATSNSQLVQIDEMRFSSIGLGVLVLGQQSQQITSSGKSIRTFNITNTVFEIISHQSALQFLSFTQIGSGNLNDTYNINNCSFQGVIYQGIEFQDAVYQSQQSVSRSISVQNSNFSNILIDPLTLGDLIITATGLITQYFLFQQCQVLSNNYINGLSLGKTILNSNAGDIDSTYILNGSQFSQLKSEIYAMGTLNYQAESGSIGLKISFSGVSVIETQSDAITIGDITLNSQLNVFSEITFSDTNFTSINGSVSTIGYQTYGSLQGSTELNLSFKSFSATQITGSGLVFEDIQLTSLLGASFDLIMDKALLKNLGSQGVQFGLISISSVRDSVLFELQVTNSVFQNETNAVFIIDKRLLKSSIQTLNTINFDNCSFTETGDDGISLGQLTVLSNDALINNYDEQMTFNHLQFDTIKQNAISLNQSVINAFGSVTQYISVTGGTKFFNIGGKPINYYKLNAFAELKASFTIVLSDVSFDTINGSSIFSIEELIIASLTFQTVNISFQNISAITLNGIAPAISMKGLNLQNLQGDLAFILDLNNCTFQSMQAGGGAIQLAIDSIQAQQGSVISMINLAAVTIDGIPGGGDGISIKLKDIDVQNFNASLTLAMITVIDLIIINHSQTKIRNIVGGGNAISYTITNVSTSQNIGNEMDIFRIISKVRLSGIVIENFSGQGLSYILSNIRTSYSVNSSLIIDSNSIFKNIATTSKDKAAINLWMTDIQQSPYQVSFYTLLQNAKFTNITNGAAISVKAENIQADHLLQNILTLNYVDITESSTDANALIVLNDYNSLSNSLYAQQLNILGGNYSSNKGRLLTSVLYVNDDVKGVTNISISGSIFRNNVGVKTNELQFDSIASLSIDGIKWASNSWKSPLLMARFLYRDRQRYRLTISNSYFNCTVPGTSLNQVTTQDIQSKLFKNPSLIKLIQGGSANPWIQTDQTVVIDRFTRNEYFHCQAAYQGGVFHLESGAQLYETQSSFTYNSAFYGGIGFITGLSSRYTLESPSEQVQSNVAYYGGLFYAEKGATVTITDAVIQNNIAVEGGLVMLDDGSHLTLGPNVLVSLNTMYKRGLIIALLGSKFTLDNVIMTQNTAYEESVIIYASNAKNFLFTTTDGRQTTTVEVGSTINNCIIKENTVVNGGRLITMQDGNLVVDNTVFEKNYIQMETMGIYAAQVKIIITNSVFTNDQEDSYYTDLVNTQLGDINGAFLSIGRNSSIYIIGTTFTGGRGSYGGCISVQGSSEIYISTSKFTSCAAQLGGAIYASNYLSMVVENSIFSQNIVYRGYSQNIFSQTCKKNLTLNGNTFYSYHNSIFFRDGVLLSLSEGNTFLSSPLRVPQIPLQEYAGGIHILNTQTIQMQGDNTFSKLTGGQGGALYIHLDLNFKSLNYTLNYVLSGLKISGCKANQDGGGIFLSNVQNVTIKNAFITNNQAPFGEGGGIDFFCNQSNVFNCSLSITKTSLKSNIAQIGGAIRWNWRKPLVDASVSFDQNIGIRYGNDWASFAREIVIIPQESDYIRFYQRQLNITKYPKINGSAPLTSYIFDSVQSGGLIPTRYFALIDDEGQVVTTNSGNPIEFSALPNQTEGTFITQVTGLTRFFSTYGVFNVSGMKLISAPSSEQHALMKVDGDTIELWHPIVEQYLTQTFNMSKAIKNYTVPITLNVRGCIKGEGLKPDGSCFQCATGTYLLAEPSEGKPTECKSCPMEKAICLGGTKIGPKPDFWRKNNITDKFLPCKLEGACLGMIEPRMLDTGECATGFHGALCASCLPGFARADKYDCGVCPNPVTNTVRVVGITIIIVGVIGFLVRSTLSSATKKNIHSVYMKILTNHLQLLSICASFNFQWPTELQQFFKSGDAVMGSTDVIFSFDCQLDTRSYVDPTQFQAGPSEMRIYYMKLMMMSCVPLLVAAIATTFWWVVLKKQQKIDQLETKLIATMVIVFFLVHPKITQAMIQMFNCTDFDGDLRLVGDLQVVCWEGLHPTITLGVALPCFIAWGLGIPAGVWVLMIRDREKLDTLAVKEKFGFLYNGYKRSSYFWEIVIMYRKILMIAISIFMNRIGLIVQALVLLIVMVGFLQLNNMRRPFASRTLNDIEDLSLMTGIVTIYCGIFFITNRDSKSDSFNAAVDFTLPQWGSFAIFIIILLANLAFVATWGIKFIGIVRAMIKERHQQLYLCLFLCCREDKLSRETEELAREAKRENIIEKIEEVQFFFKAMKKLYESSSNYEGHSEFMKALYFIEQTKANIDLTEKKHAYLVSGKMARERKLDPDRMKEIMDEHRLELDDDFVKQVDFYKGVKNGVKTRKKLHRSKTNNLQTSTDGGEDQVKPYIQVNDLDVTPQDGDNTTRMLQNDNSLYDLNPSSMDGGEQGPLFMQQKSTSSIMVFEDLVPMELRRKAQVIRDQDKEGGDQVRSRNAKGPLKKYKKKQQFLQSSDSEEVKLRDQLFIKKQGSQPLSLLSSDPDSVNRNEFYPDTNSSLGDIGDKSTKARKLNRGLTKRLREDQKDGIRQHSNSKDEFDNVAHILAANEELVNRRKEKKVFKVDHTDRVMTVVKPKPTAAEDNTDFTRVVKFAKEEAIDEDKKQLVRQAGSYMNDPSKKLISINEVKQIARNGREWRQEIKITQRLRPDPIPTHKKSDKLESMTAQILREFEESPPAMNSQGQLKEGNNLTEEQQERQNLKKSMLEMEKLHPRDDQRERLDITLGDLMPDEFDEPQTAERRQ